MDSTITSLLTGEKRRSRTKIIATILKITRNGESPTKIAEKAHLNSQQLQLYLNRLTKLDLVEIKSVNRRRIYITSEKGIHYLRQYNMLKELLKKTSKKTCTRSSSRHHRQTHDGSRAI